MACPIERGGAGAEGGSAVVGVVTYNREECWCDHGRAGVDGEVCGAGVVGEGFGACTGEGEIGEVSSTGIEGASYGLCGSTIEGGGAIVVGEGTVLGVVPGNCELCGSVVCTCIGVVA